MKVMLRRRPGSNTSIIGCIDPQEKDFGTIDARSAAALAPLMDSVKTTKIRFQARLDMRERKPFEHPGQQVSDSYSITINVYAPRKYAKGIGQVCSRSQLWLRAPLAVDRGIEVFNPHEPKDNAPAKKSSLIASTARYGSAAYITRTNEEVRKDVLRIFDTLKESDELPGMEPCSLVKTKLLPHQKQALWFMTEREKGKSKVELHNRNEEEMEEPFSLWQENIRPSGEVRWYNVITGHEVKEDPGPTLGGILADVMGLGKTLNVLSLIAGSLGEAEIWARQKPDAPKYEDDPVPVMNTKGTLLIAPLSTITNWEDQIKAHLKRKSLTYYVYHGSKRTDDIYELRNFNVVITSYSVVSADFDRRSRKRVNSPLTELNWFRIVLDEAHMIREQTTRQSKAVCVLPAQRRWAVTGTPVQNRLDDLGALIKFLRIKPFEEKGNFQQFIIAPFKSMDTEILPKLRLLVDSITLRRGKDKINLPKREERHVKLKFSEAEQGLYDYYSLESRQRLKAMMSKKEGKGLGGSAYAHILRAILRLRLLCAHGSELLSDDDLNMAKGFSVTNAIDLEDEDDFRPDRTPRQAFEMLRMMKDANMDFCGKCEKRIASTRENLDEELDSDADEDETIGYLTPCNQVICPKCIKSFEEELREEVGPDNYVKCTLCETYIRVTFFELKQKEIEADEESQRVIKQNPRLAKHTGRYTGPHTKTKALLEAMAIDQEWSDAHPDEMPIKSVIFSGWTSHLDLIQIALTDNKIEFTRLDGSMTRANRNAALNAFATSTDITCMLVSLTAGGLGLNLTAASRVYVMEPQFNPAAEAQAIERVHRLGQKRDVLIRKFIMENSFEEKMVELQEKKQSLASLSMERDNMKLGRAEAAKQKMEELKSLFK